MPDHADPIRAITLGIEMSNPSSSAGREPAHAVALFSGNDADAALIASAPLPLGARGSDGIMVSIESLCADNAVNPADIARILVSVGPGGYTALRIATTTAKLLAYTLGAELIPVPSARVAAVAIDPADLPALVMLASKKDRAHASIVRRSDDIEDAGIVSADCLSAPGLRTIVGDAHLPPSFSDAARTAGLRMRPLHLDARQLPRAARGLEPIDPLRLCPIYAREPDAVTQWRARGSG